MTTFYYTETETSKSLVVSGSVVRTIASAHPNFEKVLAYCRAHVGTDSIDMDHVLSLIDAGQNIVDSLLKVTDRIAYKGGKLLWDGEQIDNTLSAHIVRMIKSGDGNYKAFALFMEKLASNPSKASRKALFDFIAAKDFTITAEGDFIGYKGVTSDYKSKWAGYGIVNGVEFNDYLDNTPGNVVEVPRNRVNENRDVACDVGLHVGTRGYAQTWASGGKTIIVAVNPRDVVMVPRDGDGHKMRVCKYVVLEDNEAELTTTTYYGQHHVDEVEPEAVLTECDECGCDLDEHAQCACCDDIPDDLHGDEEEAEEVGVSWTSPTITTTTGSPATWTFDLTYVSPEAISIIKGEPVEPEVEEEVDPGQCVYCGRDLVDGKCPITGS